MLLALLYNFVSQDEMQASTREIKKSGGALQRQNAAVGCDGAIGLNAINGQIDGAEKISWLRTMLILVATALNILGIGKITRVLVRSNAGCPLCSSQFWHMVSTSTRLGSTMPLHATTDDVSKKVSEPSSFK